VRNLYISDGNTVGPLLDVLKHQHVLHNFKDQLSVKATKNPSAFKPSFRVHLPVEVACAASAIVEIHALDDDASLAEVKQAESKDGSWDLYEWENSVTNKRFCANALELVRFSSCRSSLLRPFRQRRNTFSSMTRRL
jgi:hypothetical protein